MKKNFIPVVAAAVAALSIGSAAAGFEKTNTYTQGMFNDVNANHWFAPSVSSSYELGFMNGTSDNMFSPTGNVTVAQAVTIAARLNDAYFGKNTVFDQSSGKNWYDCYVKYAVDNSIISDSQFDNYTRNITRAEMAVVFAKAVPSDFLAVKNNVDEIPDVPVTNSCYDEVLLLYKAGIVMGNDEYGTFKPDNSITRAEAAAIINRIAIPQNRIEGTLTDANYDDAYYLINDMSAQFNTADVFTSTTSAWVTDNRYIDTGSAGNALADYSEKGKVSVWRDIDDVSEGILGMEMKADIKKCLSGTAFKITDDNKNPLFTLETKDGFYYFQNKNTGVEVADGTLYVKVKADLDSGTADLYINGKKAAVGAKLPKITASRVYISSDEKGTSVVTVSRFDVYKDYVVNDIFLDAEGTPLLQWDVEGDAKVAYSGGQTYNDVNSALLTGKTVARNTFVKPVSGKVVFETYMLFPEKEDTGYISLNSGEKSVAKILINADGVFKGDNEKLRFHNNNIWQTLRIVADTVNNKAEYWVNGKLVGTDSLDVHELAVDNITVASESGKVFFDDVKVFLEHNYDDYCPEPVPVTDDGYNVIINVCSLWHEGTHIGWGAESAYPDIESVLGYYDEGIPEVADWEIKMMVENGIDAQHFCWYSPSKDIKEPIKRSSLVTHALHDGFFYAKYSDMMKFTFMWENSAVDVSSLENFKNYIWNYWVDYYFLDERFLTIDNKVVITAWHYDNFKKAFGGTTELALEAYNFMNEDIKKYGFDGVLLFFADQHRTDSGAFAEMANMGASGAYAYHWQQDGNNAQGTISRLEKNQNHHAIHIVPAVSVGFNNVGWSGIRKPLISLEDHKKVLEYIKNDYLPKEEGWKANTLIVSTWNEYGEGTYVMPVPGLHGFGYLDNVRQIISGVEEQPNNIVPTEQQKARLGHLYPKGKSSLERLDIEKPTNTSNTIPLYSATGDDFVNGRRIDHSYIFDGVYSASVVGKDSAVYISEESRFAPIDTSKIVALRLVMRSSVKTYSELFFLTQDQTSESQDFCFGFHTEPTEDFVEVLIDTSTNANWTGILTNIRFDIISAQGSFEIKSFELLGIDETKKYVNITVNANEYKPTFAATEIDGEVYVAAEADASFFKLHNYYYEWSRFTGKLVIENVNNDRVEFTVGSDVALVNGKEHKLKKAVETYDGLPVIPLLFLYDATGVVCDREDKLIKAYVVLGDDSEKFLSIMRNRVPYQYEFELDGDIEGFSSYGCEITVADGMLKGVAVPKANGTYDPIVTRPDDLNIKAKDYNKITIGMKHKLPEGMNSTILNVFFTTSTDKNLDQNKCISLRPQGNSSEGKVVEYVVDCTQNSYWSGTIKQFRIDPIAGGGEFEIDYIRITYDDKLRIQNEKAIADKVAKGLQLLNCDGEDTTNKNAFYHSAGNSEVSVVYDEELKSNVINVKAIAPYSYVSQKAVFGGGNKYKVTLQVRLTETASGKTEGIGTTFMSNMKYEDVPGAGIKDHIILRKPLKVEDGWQTVSFTINIPAGVEYNVKEEFCFYTNPTGGEGVGYRIDNIVVEKLN